PWIGRTVNLGLSFRMVSAPTRIASTVDRKRWVSFNDLLLVNLCDSPGGRVMRLSSDCAILAMTHGLPLTIHLSKPTFHRRQSISRIPVETAMPAFLSC